MSMFSGKCDLFDHIAGCGGWYDKDGNPVKFGQEGINCYYSDEMRDFLAFKKQTNGLLHQHKKITLTAYNHQEIKKLCPNFDYIEHTKEVQDKRCTSGSRTEKYLTYKYYNKEYTLQELNKKGIYITIDIKFDTLLDLIPYYPYIVTMSHGSTVYISDESYVDEELNSNLKYGYYSDFWQYYKQQLQDHYREIVLRYFNPTGRENIEEVIFDSDGIGHVSKAIDENFYIEWRWKDKNHLSYWTNPKVIDASAGVIKIHKNDLERFGNKMLVYYVEATDYQLYLD